MRSLSALGLLASLLAPKALKAQRLGQLPATWHSFSALDVAHVPPLMNAGDYRVEGAVVGGVVLGAAGVLLGSFACADPAADGSPQSCRGSEIGAGAVGFAVGAVLGYFVGRSLPKP